jgi:hypothetical protein
MYKIYKMQKFHFASFINSYQVVFHVVEKFKITLQISNYICFTFTYICCYLLTFILHYTSSEIVRVDIMPDFSTIKLPETSVELCEGCET